MQDNNANNQQPNSGQNVPTWFASAPEPPQKPKRSLSKKAWAGIVAAFLVVVVGAGAFAYTFWYQNPQNVLADGIMNAVTAENVSYDGLFTMRAQNGMDIKVNYNGQSGEPGHKLSGTIDITAENASYNVTGDATYMNDGTAYIKAGNLNDAYAKLMEQYGFSSNNEVSSKIVSKVDNQWIRIESSDTKEISDDASKAQACASEAMKKARNDSSLTNELVDVYKEHAFITIKAERGVQNGSYGYDLGYDEAAAKQFAEKANETKFVKQLIECDEDFKLDPNDTALENGASDGAVTIWVTQFGHEISKVEATMKDGNEAGTFVVEPTFNQGVSIEKPENSMTFDELQKDLEELFMQQYSDGVDAEAVQS